MKNSNDVRSADLPSNGVDERGASDESSWSPKHSSEEIVSDGYILVGRTRCRLLAWVGVSSIQRFKVASCCLKNPLAFRVRGKLGIAQALNVVHALRKGHISKALVGNSRKVILPGPTLLPIGRKAETRRSIPGDAGGGCSQVNTNTRKITRLAIIKSCVIAINHESRITDNKTKGKKNPVSQMSWYHPKRRKRAEQA